MITKGYSLKPQPVKDLAAISEAVIYRAPKKNATEVRKAIVEAAKEFLERSGVWQEARSCSPVTNGWYGFRHGYLHAKVIRVDGFSQGLYLHRLEGEPEGVAPIPCGIPMPLIGNPAAPSMANFVEQGGYVLVSAPGCSLPMPEIPEAYQPEDNTINPVMTGTCQADEGTALFTLNIAFGGEGIPEKLIQSYGDTIAEGAVHLLLTGPNAVRTSHGDKFNNACDTLAMRMANGGPTATVQTARVYDTLPEI